MNVLDSSGWIALFIDGKGAEYFADVLERPSELLVPTIVLFEVLRKALRDCAPEDALEASAQMKKGHVVDLDAGIAAHAVRLSLEHNLPTADSIILATARMHGALLWTMDKDFEGIEGVKYWLIGNK